MRRAAPNSSVSPKMLKQFAAASVAIAAMLAMLASGEDPGVPSQAQATQARNDLIAAEQNKLGTKKIASSLKVRAAGGFGDDGGGDFGSGGGGGGGFAPSASSSRPSLIASPNGPAMLTPPGMSDHPKGANNRKPITKRGDPYYGQSADNANAGRPPDTSGLPDAIEASRARSGSGDRNGD